MNRVLQKGCKWVLDGKFFDTEEALDLYIRSRIEDGTYNITDGELKISQSVDLQQRTKDIIERIKLDLSGVATLVTPDKNPNFNGETEDFEPYYKIDNSIGVNRFLQDFNKPGTNDKFVKPFNKDNWRDYTLKALRNEGMSFEDAQKIIQETEDTWPELSDIGTEIHKVFEQVFNGEIPIHQSETRLSNDAFNNIVQQAKELKDSILKEYPGATFYTELGILTKAFTPKMQADLEAKGYDSINGKIDLLVVDKQGNAHLYDFKVSRKEVGDWNVTDTNVRKNHKWWDIGKINAASYQLAFYAAMLKQYGIAVRDANIVPVKLDLSYNDSVRETGVKAVDKILVESTKRHLPNIISGRFAAPISQTLEQKFEKAGEEITKLLDVFNQLFPKNTTLQRIEDTRAQTEHYRNNEKYVKTLYSSDYQPNDGKKYKFKFTQWGIQGHPVIWCENEEQLQSALEHYVEARSTAKGDFCEEFGHRIQDIINGNAELESLTAMVPDDQKDWVSNRFKRYFNEGWSLESNEDLLINGIFIFTLGNRSEVVIIERNDLNTVLDLGLGKTLLGKNTKDKYIDRTKILESSNGNLGLMLAMIYIANNQEAFKDKRVTEVSVINPEMGKEKTQLNSRLIYNYNQLCDKNPSVETPKIVADCFFNDADALIQNADSRLRAENEDLTGLVNPDENQSQLDYLNMLISALQHKYPELYKANNVNNANFSSPIWQAYYYLTQARLALNGEFTSGESSEDMWFSKGMKLNGYMISSPQFSTSSDLRQLGALLQNYESDVAKEVYKVGWKVEQAFIKLYEAEGNGTQVFDSWFRRNSDGSINERFLLKDPDSSDFKGSAASREALRLFLETMQKLRRPNASETDIDEMKATEEYYEVPLHEAVWSRQIKGNVRDQGLWKGIIKTIRDKWKEAATLTKNVFAEDEVDAIKTNQQGSQLYNKFELKGQPRLQKIQEHGGVGFFETNMEIVFNQALVAFTRSKIAKDYIPRIQAMKLGLKYAQDHGGVENEKIQEAFDKIVKSKFYGESIISKDLQPLYKWLSFVRSIFTTMTLSVNIPSFLRESLQGIYTGISRAGVKLLPGVDEKNYIKALTHVIQESHKNFSSVSLLQQLNAQYQMANQSINQIANQRRVNWMNIKNWSKDTLFLTATAPDFMHRVSILVAKMMGDGCWEAHELVDGQLVYNFKKDKRFEQYLAGNTSHKDYLTQKSLYETMIDEFNQSGYTKEDGSKLEIGDDLPQAYTNREAQSIKNYADLLYGHYDESSRALINDTFLGSFFLQYKTYITAKFEQWTMPSGIYNTSTLKQQFDPITGEELYQTITYDENGKPIRNIVRKSQITQEMIDKGDARLYYDYEGIPMEGLFQEMSHFAKSIASLDFKKFKELWDNPTDRGFLLLGLHDQFLMALLMFLATFVFGNVVDADNPWNPAEVGRKIRDYGPLEQLAYNVIQGSTVDAQFIGMAGGNNGILQSMGANPPLLTAIKRFSTTNMKMIQGKQSLAYTASQNFGAIRTFQGLIKQMDSE